MLIIPTFFPVLGFVQTYIFAATTPCTPNVPMPVGATATSSDTCQNAVVSVTYTLTWDQNSITNVQAEIITANVPLSDTSGKEFCLFAVFRAWKVMLYVAAQMT